MPKLKSPIPGYGQMTARRGKYDYPPPPWPLSDDPRTDACTHDWTNRWGAVGERQHLCLHCDRWIWELEIHAVRVIPPEGWKRTR